MASGVFWHGQTRQASDLLDGFQGIGDATAVLLFARGDAG